MGFINLTYKVVVIINEIIQKKPSMLYLGKCKFSVNSQCGGHPIFRLLIPYSLIGTDPLPFPIMT